MGEANSSVLVIDDDPEFRDSVARLLRTVGMHTRQFSSVHDFLKADPPEGPTCLVLDVRMPGRSGLELQRDLAAANRQVPIIFITAHACQSRLARLRFSGTRQFSPLGSFFGIQVYLLRPAYHFPQFRLTCQSSFSEFRFRTQSQSASEVSIDNRIGIENRDAPRTWC